MQDNLPLTIDDVQFDTMPAGSASVKAIPLMMVNVFFIAFL